MADSKSVKKPATKGTALLEISFGTFLVVVFLLSFIVERYYPSSMVEKIKIVGSNFVLLLPDYAVFVMHRLFSFSFTLSLILIAVIIYLANAIISIRKKTTDSFDLPVQEKATESNLVKEMVNEKWQGVITHINSENPSDWKLAILECDIMLGEILEKMGYMQESIGEKLKAVEPSDFSNIESAWEAHKIRNSIAHEGSDFVINEREAKRVIGLYEVVFREFECI